MSQQQKPFVLDAPEEVLSTMHKDGRRRWMYPKLSRGRMFRWRLVVAWALIALFLGLPVLKIGGAPAVFLDIIHRKFALFGFQFFATDTFLLMTFGFIVIASVVIFTALFGRVWCGWACPQTVYLEFIFRPIERLIEGKESARKKRDAGPANLEVVLRKTIKYTLFTAVALVLAHTFVAYFVSWEQLFIWMSRSPTEHPGFFVMMGLTTGLVVFDFAYFREQMCVLACPYARIQSVLMDRNSMIVSYDPNRGESRGRRTRAQREQEAQGIKLNLGDCVDCGACVRTCPTGIDIRDGLQMECIGCTQCIDACDVIMIGVGKPTGLIRYTSENELEGQPTRLMRPRVVIYAGIMAIMIALFGFGLTRTQGLDIEVIRSVGAPFQRLPDGQIANRVKIRVQNRTNETVTIRAKLTQPEGTLRFMGREELTLKPNQLQRLEAWIVVSPDAVQGGKATGEFLVGDGDKLDEKITFPLLGPS